MYESISKNNELENEMTLDMSYFWYSDKVYMAMASEFQSNQQFLLQESFLPEVKCTVFKDRQTFQVVNVFCAYDVYSHDFLCQKYFHVNFHDYTMNCMDKPISTCIPASFTDNTCLHSS